MNYPKEIWADTDLVCSDEHHEGWQKYQRVDAPKCQHCGGTGMIRNDQSAQGWDDCIWCDDEAATTRKLKSDAETDAVLAAVNNLVEIVEGVRSVRWAHDQLRLKDTPEWCALYSAWSKQGASDRRSNNEVRHAGPDVSK
jgi:hypothetical protein